MAHSICNGRFLSFRLFHHLLLFLPVVAPSPIWDNCPTDRNYTADSPFHSNLELLLASLSSPSTAAAGFFNNTVSQQTTSPAYGLALCRGDVSIADCQTCLDAAARDIVTRCPNGTRSAISYDDCLLRYSDERFFSAVDTSIQIWLSNTNNVTDPQRFDSQLGNLMDVLTREARDSPRLFAVGSANLSSFHRLFGLVQCTRDLRRTNVTDVSVARWDSFRHVVVRRREDKFMPSVVSFDLNCILSTVFHPLVLRRRLRTLETIPD